MLWRMKIFENMITVKELLEIGFIDEAENGLAYRWKLPSPYTKLELAYYVQKPEGERLSFQTYLSGFSITLFGVQTISDLVRFRDELLKGMISNIENTEKHTNKYPLVIQKDTSFD